MKRCIRAAAFLILFTSGCCTLAPSSGSKPFLWVVEEGASKVYLLGTIHSATADLYPLDPRIEKAFSESTHLVVEVDTSENKGMQPQTLNTMKAVYPNGDSLEKHLPPEVLKLAEQKLKKYGMKVSDISSYKPWFLALTLDDLEMNAVGLNPQNGIDAHFIQEAKGHKKIIPLETVEQQLEVFNGMTDQEQILLLKNTLTDLDQLGSFMKQSIRAWKSGDEEKLNQLLNGPMTNNPDFKTVYQKVFDERNERMAKKIEKLMKKTGIYFVAVGAGHLVGHKGLIQLLGKRHGIINVADVKSPESLPIKSP